MKLNCSFSILTILFCLTISTITAYEGEDFQPALHTNKKLVTYPKKHARLLTIAGDLI